MRVKDTPFGEEEASPYIYQEDYVLFVIGSVHICQAKMKLHHIFLALLNEEF